MAYMETEEIINDVELHISLLIWRQTYKRSQLIK